jgi:hypothetical protein
VWVVTQSTRRWQRARAASSWPASGRESRRAALAAAAECGETRRGGGPQLAHRRRRGRAQHRDRRRRARLHRGGRTNPQKARVLLMLGLTRTNDPRPLQKLFFTY